MNKKVNKCREILFDILVAIIIISAILVIGSEFMPTSWLGIWVVVNIVSVFLAVYVFDPRIYYRRLIPFSICLFSIIYVIFRPILRHNRKVYRFFYRCHKIKELAGSFENCYFDVQEVYEEMSGYAEDIAC